MAAKPGSIETICSACATPSVSADCTLFASVKIVVSTNSISPSNICALLAKCR